MPTVAYRHHLFPLLVSRLFSLGDGATPPAAKPEHAGTCHEPGISFSPGPLRPGMRLASRVRPGLTECIHMLHF